MRLASSTLACAAAVVLALPVAAEEGASTADELLAEGWRLYSEELEFEAAAEVFAEASDTAGATEAQQLEALEYLAACRFALEDGDGARAAIRRLLEIDRRGNLHDPSHPPDLLLMVEQVRSELPSEGGEEPDVPEFSDRTGGAAEPDGPAGGGEPGSGFTAGPSLEDQYPDRPARPWYMTWWFWTIAGVVVVGGVTAAVVLSLPSGEAEPPNGSLEPGVVQLPCTGFSF